jgi:hypothetical protein
MASNIPRRRAARAAAFSFDASMPSFWLTKGDTSTAARPRRGGHDHRDVHQLPPLHHQARVLRTRAPRPRRERGGTPGEFPAHRISFVGNKTANEAVVVSAADIDELLAKRLREADDSYSLSELAEKLGLQHRNVDDLVESGELVEVTTNPRHRRARHGNRGGGLPGGGRRIRKAEANAFLVREADAIQIRKEWLKIGEAADMLGWDLHRAAPG